MEGRGERNERKTEGFLGTSRPRVEGEGRERGAKTGGEDDIVGQMYSVVSPTV